MPSASLTIPATAEHVRTARVVAVAAARRAGLDEESVDDVRLAVGEVLSRVALRREAAHPGEVELVLREHEDAFEVEVLTGSDANGPDPALPLSRETGSGDDADLAFALVRALVPEVLVTGTAVTLRWPRPGRLTRGS